MYTNAHTHVYSRTHTYIYTKERMRDEERGERSRDLMRK